MFFLDKPFAAGCWRIGKNTLVAITTSSRFANSFKARPRISSLVPSEYEFEVSKKVMPSSTARLMNGRLSSSRRVHSCVPRSGTP